LFVSLAVEASDDRHRIITPPDEGRGPGTGPRAPDRAFLEERPRCPAARPGQSRHRGVTLWL